MLNPQDWPNQPGVRRKRFQRCRNAGAKKPHVPGSPKLSSQTDLLTGLPAFTVQATGGSPDSRAARLRKSGAAKPKRLPFDSPTVRILPSSVSSHRGLTLWRRTVSPLSSPSWWPHAGTPSCRSTATYPSWHAKEVKPASASLGSSATEQFCARECGHVAVTTKDAPWKEASRIGSTVVLSTRTPCSMSRATSRQPLAAAMRRSVKGSSRLSTTMTLSSSAVVSPQTHISAARVQSAAHRTVTGTKTA
mmetsp:Transcript_138678/g.431370  ORF Transcript_138678/g.431370 Transcript_138678/m.431370 type:complete len:248 (+) Transcript_138678:539-1282(+)